MPVGKKSISLQIKIMGDGNMTSEQIGAIMQKAIDAVSKVVRDWGLFSIFKFLQKNNKIIIYTVDYKGCYLTLIFD